MLKNINVEDKIATRKDSLVDVTKLCVDSYKRAIKSNFSCASKLKEDSNYDLVMYRVLKKVIFPINDKASNDLDIFQVSNNDELIEMIDSEIKYGKLHIYKVNDIKYINNHKNIVAQINFDSSGNTYINYFAFTEKY